MFGKSSLKMMAAVLLVTIVLTACSDGKNNNSEEKKADEAVITLQMRQPESFNPLNIKNHSVRDVFSLCYDPLFELDENLNIRGVLAESIQVSDDCLSAVVTLKDSVVWHDGIKLTSADVVHTVNVLQENTSWEYYQCIKNIRSIQVVDPLSFVVSFSKPYGQIAYSLTFPIIASHNKDVDDKIIGTGAFCLDKYNPATMMELKSFDQWHGGEVKCEKVNINIIRDAQTATTSFNTGLISVITSESFDGENNVPKKNTSMTAYHSNKFEFFAMNHKNTLFSSQNIRNAMSSAIDRTAIVNTCFSGNATATASPVHPISHGVAVTSAASQYSLANANELLFLEGFSIDESTGILRNSEGEEFSFEILVNRENQSRVNTAKLLREQFFAAGMNVKVKEVSYEEYMSRIKRGEFDSYLGGTRIQNIYDLEFLFSKDGTLNNFNYSGEDMEAALEALAESSTEDALENAVNNFEEVFYREHPVCGLLFAMETLMTAETITRKQSPCINNPYNGIHEWSTQK